MSILSRITRGVGFGAKSLSELGLLPISTVATPVYGGNIRRKEEEEIMMLASILPILIGRRR